MLAMPRIPLRPQHSDRVSSTTPDAPRSRRARLASAGETARNRSKATILAFDQPRGPTRGSITHALHRASRRAHCRGWSPTPASSRVTAGVSSRTPGSTPTTPRPRRCGCTRCTYSCLLSSSPARGSIYRPWPHLCGSRFSGAPRWSSSCGCGGRSLPGPLSCWRSCCRTRGPCRRAAPSSPPRPSPISPSRPCAGASPRSTAPRATGCEWRARCSSPSLLRW
mmetsp:Transcript_58933/g.166200  ORF Transcript_58933/g.166200 Transcript_58933/m.166200 type:complete len:223 (+) Transcript_58933:36-704(+)